MLDTPVINTYGFVDVYVCSAEWDSWGNIRVVILNTPEVDEGQ
jgi:hypothetical protein